MTDRFAGVVVVAAGRGERFGDRGKVLAEAAGRPLLAWSLDAIARTESVREIVIVCGDHNRVEIERLIVPFAANLPILLCTGGAERQDSVRAGLGRLPEDIEVAVIHDAARPLATAAMFDDVAVAARDSVAAIAAIPVTDTIKEAEGSRVAGSIPRERLRAAQTPQAFRRDVLARALDRAEREGARFTDEAGLMGWAGHAVVLRPGAPSNLKVTVPEDMVLVDALLRHRMAEETAHVST